jgi:hypothetical protein
MLLTALEICRFKGSEGEYGFMNGLGCRGNVRCLFLSPVIMVFYLSFSISLSNIRTSCVTGVIARVRTEESLVATS